MRDFSPTRKAVMVLGVRFILRTRSASNFTPGIGLPENQSLWMASMPCRCTCSERSTGVPLGAKLLLPLLMLLGRLELFTVLVLFFRGLWKR